MRIRRGDYVFKSLAFFEVFLLISFSFFVAFVLSESVSAAEVEIGQTTSSVQIPSRGSGSYLASKGLDLSTVQVTLDKSELVGFDSVTSSDELLVKGDKFFVSEGKTFVDGGGGHVFEVTEKGIESINSEFTSKGYGSFSVPTSEFQGSLFGLVDVPGNILGRLANGLTHAVVVIGVIQLIGGIAGLDEGVTNAASFAALGGILAYEGVKGVLVESGTGLADKIGPLTGKQFAGAVGIGVAVAIFVLTYEKEEKESIVFECLPWEAPVGGENCEVCNEDPLRPCSEYRCRSLGQACEIVNPGTEEEACVWVNRDDVESPTIDAWEGALSPRELEYRPDNTVRGNDRGVKIVSDRQDGCLQAFTPLEFGIEVNEPARCKIDWERDKVFEEMQFFFGESNLLRYNHTQKMRLPASENLLDSPLLENDGDFNLFVRCQDANGKVNEDQFVFSFCVDESPDTTPPIIEGSSIRDGGFVRFNADSVPIELYINEPSECKWSRNDKSYEDMENSLSCGTESYQVNADLQYTCSGDLTGIENQGENKFYFRCKDQPGKPENERFVNVQSFPLTLRGSQELNIIDIEPNGTITGSSDTVPVTLEVRTDDGAEEGKAICYFSNTGVEGSFIAMFETNDFVSRQTLDLTGGNYVYSVRCIDAGGNSAEAETAFTVFVDKSAPKVTRVYNTLDSLKITTDEDAECVYSTQSCNFVFSEGLPLIHDNVDKLREHFAKWENNAKYYVKCRDDRGNEPSPNSCSIVASAVNLDSEL